MANVLKSDSAEEKAQSARDVSGLAGFNLNDLADEGRTRLDECRKQIRQMLAEAKEQSDTLLQEAKQQGYDDGLARAAKDADKKLKEEAEICAQDGLKAIRQAVELLRETHEEWIQQYADMLVQISIAAAERIVSRRLENEPELLVQWAEQALQSTRAATSLTLAAHPETLAQLGRSFDELVASSDLPEQTHVEADESVERTSIVIRQVGGDIDAGLKAQLQRLEEMLS
jgi:flagellar assembly protein FliH